MSYSRRSPSLRWISLWATTIVAVESTTDLFVASYWLERSSSRFSVTLLVFSRADHSTLQVLTTFYVLFISTFYWRLAPKALQLIRLLWLVHYRDVTRHGFVVMHEVSKFLRIFYSCVQKSKHASSCSASIRPSYLSQPQLNGFTIQWPRIEPAYYVYTLMKI